MPNVSSVLRRWQDWLWIGEDRMTSLRFSVVEAGVGCEMVFDELAQSFIFTI